MKKQLLNLVLLAIPALGLLAFKNAPVNSNVMEYFLPWVNYCANEAPDSFTPAFSSSNTGGTYVTTVNSGVVNVTTGDGADNGSGNAMWRQYFSADDPLTVVIRAKVNPDAVRNLAFSIDIDLDPERFEVQIRKYGDGDWRYNISQGYPGSGDDQNADLGIDPTEWHIYRFTKTGGDGSTCSLYIDENPTPLYSNTTSATGRTNTYFRFGDGWGSGTINTDFDWVLWDNTGAYSPTDQALPTLDGSCAVLSASRFDTENFWAGPVPTSDYVYINHPYLNEKTQISVFDLSGKLIKTLEASVGTERTQIDMSGFTKGLYIVKYQNGSSQQQFKVLKQ